MNVYLIFNGFLFYIFFIGQMKKEKSSEGCCNIACAVLWPTMADKTLWPPCDPKWLPHNATCLL